MARFYIDTSGKKTDRVMAAGGYLNSEERWKAFGKAWNAILRDVGVKEFHATDFFNGRGEFSGLKPNSDEQIQLCKRFARACDKHAWSGVVFAFDVRAFETECSAIARKMQTPHGRETPLMFSVIRCLSLTLRRWPQLATHKAALIVEDEPGLGETLAWLEFLRRKTETWLYAFPTFTAAQKSELPLQAADFLVHETWRRVTETCYPTGRPVRKSFEALIESDHVTITYIPAENMGEVAREYQIMLHKNPYLRVDPDVWE